MTIMGFGASAKICAWGCAASWDDAQRKKLDG